MFENNRQNILQFYMLWIAGKCNFECKLRYLEAAKQLHLKMKNVSRTRSTYQTIKITCQNHRSKL